MLMKVVFFCPFVTMYELWLHDCCLLHMLSLEWSKLVANVNMVFFSSFLVQFAVITNIVIVYYWALTGNFCRSVLTKIYTSFIIQQK